MKCVNKTKSDMLPESSLNANELQKILNDEFLLRNRWEIKTEKQAVHINVPSQIKAD